MGLQLEPPWRLSIPACVGLPVAAALRRGQEPNVKAPAPNPPKPASANSKPNAYAHHRLAHAEDRDRALQGPLPTFPITRLTKTSRDLAGFSMGYGTFPFRVHLP